MQRRNFNNGFDRAPPVNVGEEVDVRIEAVGEKGDGVAKKNGFVIFVPNTKENEEVRIKITKVLKQVGFGEVIGKAQGSITPNSQEEAIKEAKPAKPKEEETFEYDESKDSEDFGDEPEEEGSEDAPKD